MKERYEAIQEKSERLQHVLSKRVPVVQDFLERFEMSWVYHDNALEGVVYTQQELLAALRPGAIAAEASLMPIVLEIRNHKSALDTVREEARSYNKKNQAISMSQVRRIHDLLSGNTPEAQAARAAVERRERSEKEIAKEREKAGFRKDMPLHRTYFHEIQQPSKIQPALDKLLDYTTTAEFREQHPIIQAARVQHGFIQIFPFTEHSGKVGRMLTNLILMRNKLFPCVVHAIDRQRYYEGFRGTVGGFANLLMDAMENSIDNGLKYFKDLDRKYRTVN